MFVYFVLLGGVFGSIQIPWTPRAARKLSKGVTKRAVLFFHVKDSSMKDPLKVVINAKEPLVILLRKESQ